MQHNEDYKMLGKHESKHMPKIENSCFIYYHLLSFDHLFPKPLISSFIDNKSYQFKV